MLKELISKYQNGECTEDEKAILESWYLQWNEADRLLLSETRLNQARNKSHQELEILLGFNSKVKKLWPKLGSVAAVLLLAVFTLFYINHTPDGTSHDDIQAGGYKAYLTLASGEKISLTDAANGQLAREAGVAISKTANGEIVYTTAAAAGSADNQMLNTIETPNGGKYQVRLPDGSKVWLNAASKLSYPISFDGNQQREVTLSGEAYFEITKDPKHPFRVNSATQYVEVLGTHFNVNTYRDEAQVRTTLLEGVIRVNTLSNHSKILKPGQQSVLKDNTISVSEADVAEALAWKNDLFKFNGKDLESIMKEIARWYDVEVIYPSGLKTNWLFEGELSRKSSLSTILSVLESTGDIKFEVKGRRVTLIK